MHEAEPDDEVADDEDEPSEIRHAPVGAVTRDP